MAEPQPPKCLFANKIQAWQHLNPTKNYEQFKRSNENYRTEKSWIEASELFDLHFRKWSAGMRAFKALHPTYMDERNRRRILRLENKKRILKEREKQHSNIATISRNFDKMQLKD
jgi:hypothetical protein